MIVHMRCKGVRVRTIVPVGLVEQLINVHVEIPVEANTGAVGPENSRVPDPGVGLQVPWVVVIDGVLSGHELINQAIAVTYGTKSAYIR